MRAAAVCLLLSAPLSSHAATCTTTGGENGECTDEGCCTDQHGTIFDLADLGGDMEIPGPQTGPDGKKYLFSLFSNIVDVPQVCQEFDPPIVEFNALQYDDNADKADDSCEAIGCDINPLKHTRYDGLHVESSDNSDLQLEYKNLELGESALIATLSCEMPGPSSDMGQDGVGFPENLDDPGTSEKWRLTWRTAYVCEGVCTGAPGPNMTKVAGANSGTTTAACIEGYSVSGGNAKYKCADGSWQLDGEGAAATCAKPRPAPAPGKDPGSDGGGGGGGGTTVVIVLLVLVVLGGAGAGGYVLWKKKQGSGASLLDEHLDKNLEAGASIGGSE
jgi:hypothetical protein